MTEDVCIAILSPLDGANLKISAPVLRKKNTTFNQVKTVENKIKELFFFPLILLQVFS